MSSNQIVYGTTTTSFLVDLGQQSCMNCALQWNYHAILRFDMNTKTIVLACLHRQQPTTIVRPPAIEPAPPPAIGRDQGYLPPPPRKMIEPRRP